MLKLLHTSVALDEFDAGESERDAMVYAAEIEQDVWHWEAECYKAWVKVQHAFWLDTQHINSRDHCRSVGDSYVREMVKKYRG